ncbi:hypothetical protein [Nonomuraea typhae]|uniref:hypothetical protein n=1 Tax=Nonomuraea typhae TaxID=2603600 RepID=UPI0012FAF39F|nr:hypothetical protein [Nonomuraea typhae]
MSLLTASAVTNASTAAAATARERDVGVLISQRRCNVGEKPRQIVLFLGIGGDEDHRCYGGVTGSIALPNLGVFELYSGGYTGVIDCQNNLHFFRPNERKFPIDVCNELTILPA